jgi:hypothetical protein
MTEYKPRKTCENCSTGRNGGVCTCRPAKTRRPGR